MKPTHQSTRRYLLLFGTAFSAALLASSPIRAQATNCALVKATSLKMFDVPYHMYMIDSGAANEALNGGKPTAGEVISAGGQMYVLHKGKWLKSPVSLAELKKDQNDSPDSTKVTCSHLRDESVNGEAAAVWRSHVVNDVGTIDSDMWISKSRGVLLKSVSMTDVGGAMGKSSVSARYDYTNVRPPAGVP
jgi:hypothetical protein